jgi:hypothetical protein
MKRFAWVMIIVSIVLIFSGVSRVIAGDNMAPLVRSDFERGLMLAKGLPVSIMHGLDFRDVHRIDWNHPELRAWSEHVEEEFFAGNQLYVNLVHAFTLVECNVRLGAHESAIALLRSIMAHPDFERLMLDCYYFMPSI